MKEKKALNDKVETNTVTPEALSDIDRGLVENSLLKKDLALEKVKYALTQSENAELSHNNVILQLALKYQLGEGDIITENGTIQRKGKNK